jgi:hypothetical protein
MIFRGMIRGIAKETGKPLLKGPDRFAPGLHHVCAIPPER